MASPTSVVTTFRLQAAATVLLGLLLGGALSVWQSGRPSTDAGAGSAADVRWTTDPDIGRAEAGAVLRARTARRGLFALTRSEAVYFVRTEDDAGRRLDPSCTYALSGGDLPAAWWSITVYGEDDFLVRNDDDAASVNAQTRGIRQPARAPGTGWSATVGPARPEDGGPWLSTRGADGFDLTLRLYEPDEDVLLSGAVADLPGLRRVSCGERA